MGCGAQRAVNDVVQVKRKQPNNTSNSNNTSRNEETKGKVVEVKRKKSVNEIAVTPSQFILKQDESILKNYTLKEKLGEGKRKLRE